MAVQGVPKKSFTDGPKFMQTIQNISGRPAIMSATTLKNTVFVTNRNVTHRRKRGVAG